MKLNNDIHYNIFAGNQRVGSIIEKQNEDNSYSAKITLIVKTGEYKKVSPTITKMPSFSGTVKDFRELSKDKLDLCINEYLTNCFENYKLEMSENNL